MASNLWVEHKSYKIIRRSGLMESEILTFQILHLSVRNLTALVLIDTRLTFGDGFT